MVVAVVDGQRSDPSQPPARLAGVHDERLADPALVPFVGVAVDDQVVRSAGGYVVHAARLVHHQDTPVADIRLPPLGLDPGTDPGHRPGEGDEIAVVVAGDAVERRVQRGKLANREGGAPIARVDHQPHSGAVEERDRLADADHVIVGVGKEADPHCRTPLATLPPRIRASASSGESAASSPDASSLTDHTSPARSRSPITTANRAPARLARLSALPTDCSRSARSAERPAARIRDAAAAAATRSASPTGITY